MNYYEEVYKKRLNRFGTTYQSRVQGEREYLFDLYLEKSTYRVEFEYGGCIHIGSLERNKQDNSETRQYLLTTT